MIIAVSSMQIACHGKKESQLPDIYTAVAHKSKEHFQTLPFSEMSEEKVYKMYHSASNSVDCLMDITLSVLYPGLVRLMGSGD